MWKSTYSGDWQLKVGCKKCNSGFLLRQVEHHGILYDELVPCTCWHKANARRMLLLSGVKARELEKNTFEAFDEATEEAAKMKRLAYQFLEDETAGGLGYFGASGTGKTHICTAVINALVERGRYVRYFAYLDEIRKLGAAYYEDSYQQQMQVWTDADVLYIDDFYKTSGKDTQPGRREISIALELINNRYREGKVTIFSSEYSLQEIKAIDEATGGRIYEMIMPYGMKCEGKNRRLKKVV